MEVNVDAAPQPGEYLEELKGNIRGSLQYMRCIHKKNIIFLESIENGDVNFLNRPGNNRNALAIAWGKQRM